MTDDRHLDQLFGLLAEEGRKQQDPAEHPSDGKLSFYHAGKLAPEEEERVREHVVACRRCRGLLLEYADFVGSGEGAATEGVADFRAAAEWRRGQKRMGTEARDSPPARPINRWAAVLIPVFVGLALYTFSLQRELGQAVTDSELTTLRASGSQRSPDDSLEMVRLPQFLVLPIPSDQGFPKYRLEFRAERNRIRSIEDTIETDGTLRFFLPKRFLKPGKYQIDVLGVQGASAEPLATYDIRIVE